MIPGSNLFNRASRLIRPRQIEYYPFVSRVKNNVRLWVSTFGEKQILLGSVQAVPRNRYTQLGLDFQRNYSNIFLAKDAVDLQRNASGDQFVFDGFVYQIESNTRWFTVDGWNECLVVEIAQGSEPIEVQET